jgi:hypothetical protein
MLCKPQAGAKIRMDVAAAKLIWHFRSSMSGSGWCCQDAGLRRCVTETVRQGGRDRSPRLRRPLPSRERAIASWPAASPASLGGMVPGNPGFPCCRAVPPHKLNEDAVLKDAPHKAIGILETAGRSCRLQPRGCDESASRSCQVRLHVEGHPRATETMDASRVDMEGDL